MPSQEIAAESSIVMIVSAQHSSSCRSRLGERYNCLPSIVLKRRYSALEG